MDVSKFNESMREWIDKHGIPKTICFHPDDLPKTIPDGWPLNVEIQASRYIEKGSVLFSALDLNMSNYPGIAPDYEIPMVDIKWSPKLDLYLRIQQMALSQINEACGMTGEQLGLPVTKIDHA